MNCKTVKRTVLCNKFTPKIRPLFAVLLTTKSSIYLFSILHLISTRTADTATVAHCDMESLTSTIAVSENNMKHRVVGITSY